MFASIHADGNLPILLDCARQFSPLIEITSSDTVTFDIQGLGSLYGSAEKIAQQIQRRIGLPAHIAIAANPDAAVHAARGFAGITVMAAGQEAHMLAPLSLIHLNCPPQIGELLDLWGIRTFGQFAQLPPLGVAARMGEEGVYWQRIAQGGRKRQLRLVEEAAAFHREMDLEDTIPLLEPLFFLLSRLLLELCTELATFSLATHEVRLQLGLEEGADHVVTLRLPVPLADQKTLLKLLQLELSERPPAAAIRKLRLEMEPAKPRTVQDDLFLPAYPSPEKVALTVARVRHLVGAENIGSPRVLDTHQPDSFVLDPFLPSAQTPGEAGEGPIRLAFRRFRPPERARVIAGTQPVRITSAVASGEVTVAKGPWFTSGNWWRTDTWNREEWDIALGTGALYRIFRDLSTRFWFVEGNYD